MFPVRSYITDCTPDGSRAKIFSTMQAMLNIGMASGPWVSPLPELFTVLLTDGGTFS
jgi:hypothetical protein